MPVLYHVFSTTSRFGGTTKERNKPQPESNQDDSEDEDRKWKQITGEAAVGGILGGLIATAADKAIPAMSLAENFSVCILRDKNLCITPQLKEGAYIDNAEKLGGLAALIPAMVVVGIGIKKALLKLFR